MTIGCVLLLAAGLAAGGEAKDVVLQNDACRLTLGADGRAKSLVIRATGEECLDTREDLRAFAVIQDRPFNNEIKLTFPNCRSTYRARRLRREGDFLYVGFEHVSYEAKIRVTERPDYISFELVDFPLGPLGANGLAMTYPPVDVLKLLELPVRNRAHFGSWLNVSWDDAAAVSVLAADPMLWVANEPRHGFRLMTAEARRGLKLRGAKAVLVAAPTARFMDAMSVVEGELGLPPGVKGRRDPHASRSIYWTTSATPENLDRHIALAKRGGFRNMLFYYPVFTEQPSWSKIADYLPRKSFPKGYGTIREMVAKVKAAGLSPGLHVLQTFIGFDTHYVTPVADPRLNLKTHFTLSRPLSETDKGDVFVNEDPSDSPTNAASRILAFGGELLHYEDYVTERPYRFTGVTRGDKRTRAVAHPAGQIGGILDVCEFGAHSCYIDQRTDLQDEIAAKIARIWDCGFEFMYNDGSEGVNVPQGIHVANAQYRVWKACAAKPRFTEGAAKSHFGWHLQAGANAFDVFPPEEFKAMIVRWPLAEAPLMREDFTRVDFGWWALHLPGQKIKGVPTVGTQPDMWEFGTSKAAAWDCPATISMNLDAFAKHPRGEDLLEVMRRWEDVRAHRWLTPMQRQALKDPQREFHLYLDDKGAYELVEISMLPTPASAPQLRGFVFERKGRRVIAYWHTSGQGAFSVTLDGGRPRELVASGRRYLETDLSVADVRKAFASATE